MWRLMAKFGSYSQVGRPMLKGGWHNSLPIAGHEVEL